MHNDLFTFILDHLAAHLINVDRIVCMRSNAFIVLTRAILRLNAPASSGGLLHHLLLGLLLL